MNWRWPELGTWKPGRRVLAVARKELRQLVRDRLSLGFVVGLPLAQLLLFGYAINQDIRRVPTAVVDPASSAVSRRLLGQLAATQALRFTATAPDEATAERMMRAGEVMAVVSIPADFARRYYRGRGAEIAVWVDASDPLTARAVQAAVEGLSTVLSEASARGAASEQRVQLSPDLVRVRPVDLTVHPRFNQELRTPVFVVPGLLGVILTTTMILMTSLSLVRERERGSFEFLIATPVSRLELMLGKIAPYVGIGLVQAVLVVVSGLAFFRIPVRGSLFGLALATLLFIAANLALGLVISAVTRTQNQATQLSFFFFLPSVLLSGFMFPFAAMPAPARWLGELLPLTHYIRVCRAVLLRGASWLDLPGDLAATAGFGIAALLLATRLFTKSLD